MTNITKARNDERRRFFRINDDINLVYSLITDHSLAKDSYLSNDILSNCKLSTALDLMNQDAKISFQRIEQQDPDVARFLGIINKKIELLAQAVTSLGYDSGGDETRNVNLSASGVAFECAEELQLDATLEIKMVLNSMSAVLVTFGKVVYCRENNDDSTENLPFQVGVDFVNLQDSEQELINKHIIRKQFQMIRDRKEAF